MMRSMGVVLLPLCEAMEELVTFQARLQEFEPLTPVLGLDEQLPHVTLLQGTAERELLSTDELAQVSELLCAAIPECLLTVSAVEFVEPGWYFLMLEPEAALRRLQSNLLGICGERLRITEEALSKDLSGYTEAQREYFRAYGYRFIGSEYRPHITLGRNGSKAGRCGNQEILQIARDEWVGRGIPVERISLCGLGEYGAYLETIAAVEF